MGILVFDNPNIHLQTENNPVTREACKEVSEKGSSSS